MSVSPIPEGYHSVTAYLIIEDAQQAIQWYHQVFGAEEKLRLTGPGGAIGHAEILIGDSHVMLADAHPDMGAFPPAHYGGSPINLLIYTTDVDVMFDRALEAGAEVVRPLVDQFYGDRSGMIKDPFGYTWTLATHIEDLSQAEVQQRFDDMMSGASEGH